jgi:integrase
MGRAGNGVEVRAHSIRLRFTFEGKRHAKTLMLNDEPMEPTAANVKYANRRATEIKNLIQDGTFSMAEFFPASGGVGTLTVGEQLDTWLTAQRLQPSTMRGYATAVRFWKGVVYDAKPRLTLGDKALRALRTSDIRIALASRPKLSGKAVNNYLSVLRQAIQLAVDDKKLQENPVLNVPSAPHQTNPPDPFSHDEMERICAGVAAIHPGQMANQVEMWFWSGLRTSEIFGLQWKNVDLASNSILVAEVVVRGVRKNCTKTNVSRTVKLNSRALRALQLQIPYTQNDGGPVFRDPRYGTPWTDGRAFTRNFWTPTLKQLGIRYRRPYNMRHTYATAMLMAGMNPAFCAKQLGHSVEMFYKHYARWLDGDQNTTEMALLEDAVLAPKRPRKKKSGN